VIRDSLSSVTSVGISMHAHEGVPLTPPQLLFRKLDRLPRAQCLPSVDKATASGRVLLQGYSKKLSLNLQLKDPADRTSQKHASVGETACSTAAPPQNEAPCTAARGSTRIMWTCQRSGVGVRMQVVVVCSAGAASTYI
jgi:hypothetical protein